MIVHPQDCSVKPKRTATSKLASDTASKKPRVDSVLSRDDIFSAISSGAVSAYSKHTNMKMNHNM